MSPQHRKLRRYEKIWKVLKESPDDICEIEVHNAAFAARIKKGVIKEKDMDVAFKLKNTAEKWRLEVEYNSENKKMVFKLVTRLGIMEKVV